MQKTKHISLRIVSLVLGVLLLTGTLSMTAVAVENNPFYGTSVVLGGELTVNFYVQIADTEDAVVTFQVHDVTWDMSVNQAQQISGNIYCFPCSIAAAQMTDDIKVTLRDSGKTYEKITSIRDYADKLLASRQWDMLAANDIMLATLHYGAAAQSYFEYNVENPANLGFAASAAPQIPTSSGPIISGSAEGITYYGSSLVFDSNVAVRFYFNVADDIHDYTFSGGEKPVEKNGMYFVEFRDINPQDYDKPITLTVNGSLSITYSPMNYISRKYENSDSAELKDLLNAMYQYHVTAVDYLADPYGNDLDNTVSAQ